MPEKGLHHAAAIGLIAANLSPEVAIHANQATVMQPESAQVAQDQFVARNHEYLQVGGAKLTFGSFLPKLEIFDKSPVAVKSFDTKNTPYIAPERAVQFDENFAVGAARMALSQTIETSNVPLGPPAPKPNILLPEKIAEVSAQQDEAEAMAKLRLQEIDELLSAFDRNFNGVSPELARRIMRNLLLEGFGIAGTSSTMGNITTESKGDPKAISPDGFIGLPQWSATRYRNVGASLNDSVEDQLRMMIREMRCGYKATYRVVTDQNASIYRANDALFWYEGYSKPGDRTYYAIQIYNDLMTKYVAMQPIAFKPGSYIPDEELCPAA